MIAEDTIAAIATAPGEAAIGIVRLSGPAALTVVERLFRPASKQRVAEFASHTVHLGEIVDPVSGETVDQVLLTLFRAPRSFTGEDVAELSAHGGPVSLRRILSLTLSQGARMAQRGEYTCRAFLNGKLDLAQAEAVNAVIQARTDQGLGVAVRQLEGRLSARVREARAAILPLLAHIEATIDFPEDVPEMAREEIERRIAAAQAVVAALLAGAHAGMIYREGVRLVIVGRPNVGKSSVLNALLREERAIVTEIPGTTRDVIEECANIHGIPIRTIDTAGIREARDPVEAIGVQRTLAQLDADGILLIILDASQPLAADDREILARARGRAAVIVANKCDLPVRLDLDTVRETAPGTPVTPLSAREGTGLPELEALVASLALGGAPAAGDEALVSNARHQAALEMARDSLRRARDTLQAGIPLEFVTTDLRDALQAFGQVTGESVSEEILADIFGRFCIGK